MDLGVILAASGSHPNMASAQKARFLSALGSHPNIAFSEKRTSLARLILEFSYRSGGEPGCARVCPVVPGLAGPSGPDLTLFLTRQCSG